MESATILTPLARAKAVFCFPSEPNIPEGPEYENINTSHNETANLSKFIVGLRGSHAFPYLDKQGFSDE